jgi:hypothetical protein
MGTITRSFANNITTSGVLLPASLTNNSIANVTAYNASISTGGMKLISTQTASNSASISFTTGIDSTYKEYQFYFINIHPRTGGANLSFNLSTDSGSNYNVTKTSTFIYNLHYENESSTALAFNGDPALAQETGFQRLNDNISSSADAGVSGTLTLFNPSSTTFVKHWISHTQASRAEPLSENTLVAGYGNTTSAINAIQFKYSTGNMDGDILMYGIV